MLVEASGRILRFARLKGDSSMNAFYEHHKNNIRFHYRCVDRLLLNGTIQPFQEERRVVGFFWTYRKLYPVSRDVLRDIATQFHNWVQNRSQHWARPSFKIRKHAGTKCWMPISKEPKKTTWCAFSRRVNRH